MNACVYEDPFETKNLAGGYWSAFTLCSQFKSPKIPVEKGFQACEKS